MNALDGLNLWTIRRTAAARPFLSKDLSLTRLVAFSFRGLRIKSFTPSMVAPQDLVFVS